VIVTVMCGLPAISGAWNCSHGTNGSLSDAMINVGTAIRATTRNALAR